MSSAEHAVAGPLLRDARRRANLSQSELARRARTSQAAVSDIERGRVQPTVARLDRLLRLCGTRLTSTPAEQVDPHDLQLLQLNLQLPPGERLAQQVRLMRLRGLARR